VRFLWNYPGNTGVFHLVTVLDVDTVAAPTNPTRDGWVFIGWTTDAAGNDAFDFTTAITDDLDLFAQWEEGPGEQNEYVTVDFVWNRNADDNELYLSVTIPEGTMVGAFAPPIRDGYVFQGWFTTRTGGTAVDVSAIVFDNDGRFYAQWEVYADTPFSPYHTAFLIGRPSGNIYPDANITRAEVAAVFLRLLNDDTRIEMWSRTNSFSDVNSHQWFNNEVSTMTNMGVLRGLPDGTFAPGRDITRAEVAAIVARFFEADDPGQSTFTDISGHWAEDYINLVAYFGWVNGYADGTFRPNQSITRAQFTAIITRMLDRVPDSIDALMDGRTHWPDKTNQNAWYYLYMQEASHSTEFERLPNGNLVWTAILPHIDWSLLSRYDSNPDDVSVSRGY